jgi:hypothetical protein
MRMRPVPFLFTFEVGFSLGASGILDYYAVLNSESRIICINFTTAYPAPDVTPDHTMQNTTNPAVTAKPRRKYRDPENMVTSFSMPRKLLEEAKLIAAAENRPLSNWIQVLFEREILERKRLRELNKDASSPQA